MTLQDKIAKVERFSDLLLSRYKRPVIMCSFGKDSMVMLHILRSRNLPILFHRDPWFHEKYAFASEIIEKWDLTVFDYPPIATSLWLGKGIVAFTNHYQIGLRDGKPISLALPKNIVPPQKEDRRFLCGRRDLLERPTGFFNYPWDLTFIAHKSSDEDQIAGHVPLKCDLKQDKGAPDIAFPLREWSDDDVWQYTEQFGVPVQVTRYQKNGKWTEKEDKRFNSDYWPACIACCDKREKPFVYCPLTNSEVSNISDQVPYDSPVPTYCDGK